MRVYTGGVEDHRRKADMAPVAAAVPTSTAKVEDARRWPSIEMEPKTLTLDQIKYAREAALYVVSTKTEEEAIRIFTAGLKPVQMMNNVRKSSLVDSSDDDVDLDGCCFDGGCRGSKGGRCRGRRPSSMDDTRDVATAPF